MADFEQFLKPGKRGHLIGAGGVSMAPLAEVLAGMGLVIDGSDMAESDKTRYLRSLGIDIKIGHSAMNVAPDIQFVVMHRGGADDELDIRRDIHGRVAYLDVYAQTAQIACFLALRHVGTVYHQAHAGQHLRQRRHRDASRANEMAALAGFQVLFKVCHICSKPSIK